MNKFAFEKVDGEYVIDVASQLCRFPTPLGNEKCMAIYIAEELERIGYAVELQYVVKDRPNVIAISKGDADYQSFIFNGHLDMAMPYGKWKNDPYNPWIENNALYGAGIQDMKGGVAAIMAAAAYLIQSDFSPRGDIVLAFVMHHDTTGVGAKYFLESCSWPLDAGICGEPTNLKIQLQHGGAWDWEVIFKGVPRHQSRLNEGVNAIEGMSRFLQKLNIDRFNYASNPKLPFLPRLNVGYVSGGEGPSMTAEECIIRGDIRFLPTMSLDQMKSDLGNTVNEVCEDIPGLTGRVITYAQQWPYEVSPDEQIIKTLASAYKKVTGNDAELTRGLPCGAFITDAADMIRHNIPTALFGPGDWNTVPNENILITDLLNASKIYANTCAEIISKKRNKN